MNRTELAKNKYLELFGENSLEATQDTEFMEIYKTFVFGEIFFQGKLTDKEREIITIVVLTINQTLSQLKSHVKAALNIGVTPIEIKESIYQSAPYIGFPKTLNALEVVNEVFKEEKIELPLENQSQVFEENRLEEGIKVQTEIFGDIIKTMRETSPKNLMHIQDYLSAFCFGDFYTRKGVDLKFRELITLSIVLSLGGCENQVKAHIKGNLKMGNDKELIICLITHCLPYIGFPRTLNALNCLNEIIPN